MKKVPTLSLEPRLFLLFLFSTFLFRLGFGLCSDIWFVDQQQVYILGLKYYSTGLWPFFGADVAPGIQLPGALQGLVVGLPLWFLPVPEAPYLLLNLLSFTGLVFFGWYSCRRLPQFPPVLLFAWLLTAPWVLQWSTNIDNDSYTLFGACLFFVGFLESVPAFSLKLLKPVWANALMGFGFFWCAQFHMSYVLLAPFVLYSAYSQWKAQGSRALNGLPGLVVGSLASGIFLLPTLWVYGLRQGTGGTGSAIAFNPENILSLFTLLARFLFLACSEVPRFIGAHMDERLDFLRANLWLAVPAVVAGLLGVAQALALLAGWFQKKHPAKDWGKMKGLVLATFLLIYGSFLFAIKAPASHTYYLTLPLVMLYGFYVYSPWVGKKWFLPLAKVLLVANILFQMGMALHNLPVKSLYKDRDLMVKAIAEKNYHLLSERRPDTLY